jgi:hypothetical protein
MSSKPRTNAGLFRFGFGKLARLGYPDPVETSVAWARSFYRDIPTCFAETRPRPIQVVSQHEIKIGVTRRNGLCCPMPLKSACREVSSMQNEDDR